MTTMTMGAIRARRATGAMFFTVFGGMWLEWWAIRSAGPLALEIVIGIFALAFTWAAYATYRRHAAELAAQPKTPRDKHVARMFHLINAGQWIVIIVLGNVMLAYGWSAWIVPMIIFVVGLHFMPLAALFRTRPHYVTGVVMMALAVLYPFVAPAGPADAVGLLGSGLILWASAGWAIRRH